MTDKCGLSIARALWSTTTKVTKKLELPLSARHGISFTEYMVLYHLGNVPNHQLSRKSLADSMVVSAADVTRILRPMEKIGLLKIDKSSTDARDSTVACTAAGLELLNNASVTLSAKSADTFEKLNTTSTSELLDILNLL